MMIEENEFFRETTRHICSYLEIEKSMCSCMQYIGRFMPADVMFLQLYDFEMRSMRTIAKATQDQGVQLDHLTALPDIARKALEEKNYPDFIMLNYPDTNIMAQTMLTYHNIEDASLLILVLNTPCNILGHLILVAVGKKTFSEEHAALYQLLREPFTIALANTLQHRQVLKLKDLLADDNRFLHHELLHSTGDEIVGANFGLKKVIEMVHQVATHNSPVLLLGETGTGKDLIANAIHYASPRNESPFITVNCGAIPDTLIDSELFGHEKGAFTGALTQKRGRFERAHGGTIFLDEIGELPAAAQVRLLRVLQHQQIERVGGTTPISVDIRVIAATHRNLEAMVKSNEFREDLWYRLNVIPILIPPLRDRKADIPALAQHFIEKKSRALNLQTIAHLAPGAIDDLTGYDWPGNVRELENVLERALILSKAGELHFDNLNPNQKQPHASPQPKASDTTLKLDDLISNHIRQVLTQTSGKIHGPGGAAELLGINASTLRGKMNKFGIPYGRGAK